MVLVYSVCEGSYIVQVFNTSGDGCSGTTKGVHSDTPPSSDGGKVTLKRPFSMYGVIRTIYLSRLDMSVSLVSLPYVKATDPRENTSRDSSEGIGIYDAPFSVVLGNNFIYKAERRAGN